MNVERLKTNFAKGNLKEVVSDLHSISDKYMLGFSDEILLISSRYFTIEKEKAKGLVTNENYSVEINSISSNILQVIENLEELNELKLKNKSIDEIKKGFDALLKDFEESKKIESTPTRLRMKNDLSYKISQKIIQYPDLVYQYLDNPSDGLICGISKKIQRIPDFEDLDLLEKIASKTKSRFTKGGIANAIAELIYFGKIRLGDDKKINEILNVLKIDSDKTVQKNVERVEAALEYLLTK